MAPLLLIASLAALLWLAVLLRYGGISTGVLLVALSGIVVGYPFFHRDVGPVPLTIDRGLLAIVAVAAGYLCWKRRAPLPPLHRTNLAASLFLLVLLASTLTHDWRANGFHPLATWLFFYALPFVGFALVQCTEYRPRLARIWLWSLAGLGLYLALIGLCETREWNTLVWPRFIVDAAYSEFLGRARGPLLNPIGNGILLTLGGAAAALIARRLRGYPRWLPILVVVLTGTGIVLTRTRSVWLGAAIACWVLFVTQVPRRWAVAGTCWALVLAVGLLATQWDRLNSFKRDRDVSVADMSESASLRPILATIAWKMFLDRPLLGFGLGQYGDASQPYCAERDTDLPLDKGRPFVQHNVYLSLLTETGLIGLAAYLGFLAAVVRDIFTILSHRSIDTGRRDLALLTAAGVTAYMVNGMFHEVAIIPMVHFVVFALAGWTSRIAWQLESAPTTTRSAAGIWLLPTGRRTAGPA